MLASHVASSLRFAREHLAWLEERPDLWDEQTANHSLVTYLDKALSETALLVLITSRIRGKYKEVDSLSEGVCERIDRFARSGRAVSRILRYPQVSPVFALPHLVLTDAGVHDSNFDRILRGALMSPVTRSIERFPFRQLDCAWIQSLFGYELQSEALRCPSLDSPVHPIYMSGTDAYALTHAVMFSTDFGRRPLPPSKDKERLSQVITAGLRVSYLERDFDLVGEYLMSELCLGSDTGVFASLPGIALTNGWTERGFVPGPYFDFDEYFASRREREAAEYLYRGAYHTTYVAGMACAMGLGSRGAATTPEAGDHLVPDSTLNLIETRLRLDLAEAQSQVQSGEVTANEYGDALLEGGLTLAVRRYDLDLLLHLLQDQRALIRDRCPLTFSACRQFLRHQEVRPGVFGTHFAVEANTLYPGAAELIAKTRNQVLGIIAD